MTDKLKAQKTRPKTRTVAWCATCGSASVETEVDSWLTGRHYRCMHSDLDDFHVAAAIDSRLRYWLRAEAWLVSVAASRFHPRSLCKKRPELYVPALGVVLLIAYWLTPGRATWAGTVLAAFVVLDVLHFHTMVAFVTRRPRLPLRTVMFAAAAFVQIAAAFGVFYRALPEQSFNAVIRTDFDAFYFSVITLATLGYGDIFPQTNQGWAQGIVVAEVCIGLYFIAALFATMVSWASAAPALPTLAQLQVEHRRSHEAAQQGAAPDGL